jgi:hypothetical protein
MSTNGSHAPGVPPVSGDEDVLGEAEDAGDGDEEAVVPGGGVRATNGVGEGGGSLDGSVEALADVIAPAIAVAARKCERTRRFVFISKPTKKMRIVFNGIDARESRQAITHSARGALPPRTGDCFAPAAKKFFYKATMAISDFTRRPTGGG